MIVIVSSWTNIKNWNISSRIYSIPFIFWSNFEPGFDNIFFLSNINWRFRTSRESISICSLKFTVRANFLHLNTLRAFCIPEKASKKWGSNIKVPILCINCSHLLLLVFCARTLPKNPNILLKRFSEWLQFSLSHSLSGDNRKSQTLSKAVRQLVDSSAMHSRDECTHAIYLLFGSSLLCRFSNWLTRYVPSWPIIVAQSEL